MTINAPFFNYCQSQKSSIGVEPQLGEVLAPMFVQGETELLGLDKGTLKTLRIIGVPILTAFIPVQKEEYETTVYWYNNSVNDYLKPFREGDTTVYSLDSIVEKRDFGIDDEGIEDYLLVEQLDYLKNIIVDSDKDAVLILDMLFQGFKKKDIIAKLGLQKSAGYAKVNKVTAKLEELYNEQD